MRSSGQTLTIGQHLILMEFQTLCSPKAGLPIGMLLITSAWILVAILKVALVVMTAYLLWKLMVSQCALGFSLLDVNKRNIGFKQDDLSYISESYKIGSLISEDQFEFLEMECMLFGL